MKKKSGYFRLLLPVSMCSTENWDVEERRRRRREKTYKCFLAMPARAQKREKKVKWLQNAHAIPVENGGRKKTQRDEIIQTYTYTFYTSYINCAHIHFSFMEQLFLCTRIQKKQGWLTSEIKKEVPSYIHFFASFSPLSSPYPLLSGEKKRREQRCIINKKRYFRTFTEQKKKRK